MAGKKKPTNAELMAAAAAAAQITPPIASYIEEDAPEPEPTTPPEEPKDTGEKEAATKAKKPKDKRLVSFYCNESDYQKIEKLARNRSVLAGEKNKKGQAVGAGTIICEAVSEYVKNHADEIAGWESMAEFFKPDNLKRYLEEQKRLAREQIQREIEAEMNGEQ